MFSWHSVNGFFIVLLFCFYMETISVIFGWYSRFYHVFILIQRYFFVGKWLLFCCFFFVCACIYHKFNRTIFCFHFITNFATQQKKETNSFFVHLTSVMLWRKTSAKYVFFFGLVVSMYGYIYYVWAMKGMFVKAMAKRYVTILVVFFSMSLFFILIIISSIRVECLLRYSK